MNLGRAGEGSGKNKKPRGLIADARGRKSILDLLDLDDLDFVRSVRRFDVYRLADLMIQNGFADHRGRCLGWQS